MGMNNKETCTRVYKRVCVGVDLRVYAKYTRLICICVVRIYLRCTVVFHHVNVSFETPIVYQFPNETSYRVIISYYSSQIRDLKIKAFTEL